LHREEVIHSLMSTLGNGPIASGGGIPPKKKNFFGVKKARPKKKDEPYILKKDLSEFPEKTGEEVQRENSMLLLAKV